MVEQSGTEMAMRMCVGLAALAVVVPLAVWAGEPVALRAEHFVVPPATGPVTHVRVRNLLAKPYEGTVRLALPEGWKADPAERKVRLKAGETARVPFTVHGAASGESNAYRVEVAATGAGATVVRRHTVMCASAPHATPRIDGRLGDWDDAIPVTFTARGKRTVVRTLWSERQFCVAVEVDEDKQVGRGKGAGAFDAVQFAIASRKAVTGTKPTEKAARYEFLLAAGAGLFARDRCFALLEPGAALAVAAEKRPLDALALAGARVSVRRRRGVTCYECAIPAKAIGGIRLTVGREIRFSLLVHDPDGTGLRDLGEAMGLWPSQRNRLAWCSWQGVRWGDDAPFDGKIEWGLCTSKH